MNSALITLLAILPAANPAEEPITFAHQVLKDELPTGSLLVSEGDCLAVRIYTASPYTHVAAVISKDGQPYVYDSTNGAGVRCQSLRDYLESQQPDELRVFVPQKPLSETQQASLEEYLASQVGRPYAIKHHLTGKRVEGIHCSEYVTDALMSCKLMHAENPPRVSPASLVEGILQTELYRATLIVEIPIGAAQATDPDASWCRRMWTSTKSCTAATCHQLQRWFLCR